MIGCPRYDGHSRFPCTLRAECFDECQAGWLAEPVPCERCGWMTAGPFFVRVGEISDDLLMFALICPRCARSPASSTDVALLRSCRLMLFDAPSPKGKTNG